MSRQFMPVGEILKEVLKARGLGNGDIFILIQRNWAAAVGEKITQHAWPLMLRNGRLTVAVDSPAWMSELSMLSPQIIEKINSRLKGRSADGAVSELKFRLGGRTSEKSEKAVSGEKMHSIKKRALSPDEKAAVEAATANIPDGELRLRAGRMLSNSCRRIR